MSKQFVISKIPSQNALKDLHYSCSIELFLHLFIIYVLSFRVSSFRFLNIEKYETIALRIPMTVKPLKLKNLNWHWNTISMNCSLWYWNKSQSMCPTPAVWFVLSYLVRCLFLDEFFCWMQTKLRQNIYLIGFCLTKIYTVAYV